VAVDSAVGTMLEQVLLSINDRIVEIEEMQQEN
jgi:hypothetical protein